jgi:chemotaxis protein CheD
VSIPTKPNTRDFVSVTIARWAAASAPAVLRTLLGSCVAVALYERRLKLGGLTHIVLPSSGGDTAQPGKYADTAIPGVLLDLERLAGAKLTSRLTAKVIGGASMFQNDSTLDIGRMNQRAVEQVLDSLSIPIVGRDLGGDAGRHLTFHTATGIVMVKVPGGRDYEL